MNSKYQRLQEKIQLLSKQSQDPIESLELIDSEEKIQSHRLKQKGFQVHSFSSNIPIPHYAKLEIRLKSLEDLFESSMENIEMKHKTLEEYITKLKAIIDSNAIEDEGAKAERINELCALENSLQLKLTDESNGVDSYIENTIRKTEAKMVQIDTSLAKDNEVNRNECTLILDNAKKDIEALASKLDELKNEQTRTNEQITQDIADRLNEAHNIMKNNENESMMVLNSQFDKMKQIGYSAKERNQEEARKREEFRENIIKVLNETEDSLNK